MCIYYMYVITWADTYCKKILKTILLDLSNKFYYYLCIMKKKNDQNEFWNSYENDRKTNQQTSEWKMMNDFPEICIFWSIWWSWMKDGAHVACQLKIERGNPMHTKNWSVFVIWIWNFEWLRTKIKIKNLF